jgi:hypothetical protein
LLEEELGFQVVQLPLETNSGLTPERISESVDADETERTLILIKGWAGRAIDILRALKRHFDLLRGYEIKVFCADLKVRIDVWLSCQGAGSYPTCYSKHALCQGLMGRLCHQPYIFIASLISDGISPSAFWRPHSVDVSPR